MTANSPASAVRMTLSRAVLVLAAIAVTQHPIVVKADDISDGKAAFSTCSGCHTVSGKDGVGPHLNGIIGRKAGSAAGFNYSPAMKRSTIVWDQATLEKYLQNPQSEVPGNRMPFAGLPDEKKRDAIVAYLASVQ